MTKEEIRNYNPSENVASIAKLIVRLLKTYYDVNPTLIQIQELNGDYDTIRTDSRYAVPVICSLLLQILYESERKEEWAKMLDSMYHVSLDAGASEYLSALTIIDMFELVWEEVEINGKKTFLPKIEFANENIFVEKEKETEDGK